jgi:outer membrane protein assembly factor BamA
VPVDAPTSKSSSFRWLGVLVFLICFCAVEGRGRAAPPEDAPPQDAAPPEDAPPDEELDAPPVADDTAPPDEAAPETIELNAPQAPDAPKAGCEIDNPADPLFQPIQALGALKPVGFEIIECTRVATVLQGERLEIHLSGRDQQMLMYVLERLATDGYWIELSPVGTHEVVMVVSPSRTGERGVLYARIERLTVDGKFLEGDDPRRIERILGLEDTNFYPADIGARLQALGYRAEFLPVKAGEVIIQIAPGRSIRRVRVRGHRPLAQREVQRQLSIEARPGALARGRCVEPKRLRKPDERPPLCDPSDVACREWEREEIERIERFLFDSGFLRGTASLGLSCGRAGDEADLHVYLDKGKAYKIDRRGIKVAGAPSSQDDRWIRRQFLPRSLWFFRKRVTREYMEDSDTEVETTYAEPAGTARLLTGATTRNPHPQVQVDNSYEDLSRDDVPQDRDLQLQVNVDLGREVETSFSATKTARRGANRGLSFGHDELEAQLQMFKRRETPSPAVARREAANLRAFYQSKGFLLADVAGSHQDFGAVQKLQFQIAEGPRARVRAVSLDEPDLVPPGVLSGIRKIWRNERELGRRSRLSETSVFEDLTTIIGAYNDAGYLCAHVSAKVAFWDSGLDEPGAHAVLTPEALLGGQTSAPWITQFDADGMRGILQQDNVPLFVRFEVQAGPRVVTSKREEIRYLDQPIPQSRRTDGIPTRASGAWGARRILHESPLRARGGDDAGSVPINLKTGRDTNGFVVERYRSSGFPVADAEVSWLYQTPGTQQPLEFVDMRDLADPKSSSMCQDHAAREAVPIDTVVSVYEGKRGEFGEALIRGNFKTREYVLRRELRFESGDLYDRSRVQRSVQRIEGTGTARGVTVTPYPVACHSDEPGKCRVHQVVTIEEAKDLTLDVDYGLGAATLNPTYVFLRPKFPNMWGTGWDFEIGGLYGLDWSRIGATFDFCDDQPCYEQSARATLGHPHIFGSVLDFELVGQVQRRVTPARGEIFSAYGNPRLTLRIDERWRVYFGYLIQQANIAKDLVKPLGGSNTPWVNRGQAVVPDRTGLIETGVRLSGADNPFNPNEGFLAGIDVKLASPYLGGQDWWGRIDLFWQHFIPIPRTDDRLSFRYSLRFGELFPFSFAGTETTSVPEVWRYYGGGTADLGIRGILPETMLVDFEEIALPYGGTLRRARAQGGHVRAIGTVAWQVVSVKDFLGGKLAHSLFYDFGVLTQRWDQLDFIRDYRHSMGVNAIKWDINIVTLALGYAILVPGNAGPVDDRNGRFVFDVGVTF